MLQAAKNGNRPQCAFVGLTTISSHVYDRVIALHSGDASARLRDLLIERTGIKAGDRLLDLWCSSGNRAWHSTFHL